MTNTENADISITFQVAENVWVNQFGARDLMHPSRMILTTYLHDHRGPAPIEECVGTNGFGHRLDLDQSTADSKFVAYLARQGRPRLTPAQRRAARLAKISADYEASKA